MECTNCGYKLDEENDEIGFVADGFLISDDEITMAEFKAEGVGWIVDSSHNEQWECPKCGKRNNVLHTS